MPGAQTVGNGLQLSTGGGLGASQHGGVTVRIQSSVCMTRVFLWGSTRMPGAFPT